MLCVIFGGSGEKVYIPLKEKVAVKIYNRLIRRYKYYSIGRPFRIFAGLILAYLLLLILAFFTVRDVIKPVAGILAGIVFILASILAGILAYKGIKKRFTLSVVAYTIIKKRLVPVFFIPDGKTIFAEVKGRDAVSLGILYLIIAIILFVIGVKIIFLKV